MNSACTLLAIRMQGMGCPLGRNTVLSTDCFQVLAPSRVSRLVTSHITMAAVEPRPNWGMRDRNGSCPMVGRCVCCVCVHVCVCKSY